MTKEKIGSGIRALGNEQSQKDSLVVEPYNGVTSLPKIAAWLGIPIDTLRDGSKAVNVSGYWIIGSYVKFDAPDLGGSVEAGFSIIGRGIAYTETASGREIVLAAKGMGDDDGTCYYYSIFGTNHQSPLNRVFEPKGDLLLTMLSDKLQKL